MFDVFLGQFSSFCAVCSCSSCPAGFVRDPWFQLVCCAEPPCSHRVQAEEPQCPQHSALRLPVLLCYHTGGQGCMGLAGTEAPRLSLPVLPFPKIPPARNFHTSRSGTCLLSVSGACLPWFPRFLPRRRETSVPPPKVPKTQESHSHQASLWGPVSLLQFLQSTGEGLPVRAWVLLHSAQPG